MRQEARAGRQGGAMRLEISLNGAEADALKQVLRRHFCILDGFERNQLVSVVKKTNAAREDLHNQRREAWRRFVWTQDDITIVRHSRGRPDLDASSESRCACECHGGRAVPRSAPGQAWCSDCLAESASLMTSSFIEEGVTAD